MITKEPAVGDWVKDAEGRWYAVVSGYGNEKKLLRSASGLDFDLVKLQSIWGTWRQPSWHLQQVWTPMVEILTGFEYALQLLECD